MNNDYKQWIVEVKQKIRSTQIKAAIAVNSALIEFYWDLGKMISEKIKHSNWGDKILENVSKDLREEFPDMKGLSVSNLKTCKLFYAYFSIGSQPVNQNKMLNLPIGSQIANEIQTIDIEQDAIIHQNESEISLA